MGGHKDSAGEMTFLGAILEITNALASASIEAYYVFRGETRIHDKVPSGLYRDTVGRMPGSLEIEVVQQRHLEEAKKYTHETDEMTILTELQHYGAKTNLIDFTTDYLIALFFACDGNHLQDGRVILFERTEERKQYIYESPHVLNRALAQKSVFVRPPEGYVQPDRVVEVPSNLKVPILDYLHKAHGISSATIYNDLHGYIRLTAIHREADDNINLALFHYNQRDYPAAMDCCNKAIALNPVSVNAYGVRGSAHRALGNSEQAIADYSRAIELAPGYAVGYQHRGDNYCEIGKLDLGLSDYGRAAELDPTNHIIHASLSAVYIRLGQHAEALAAASKAIEVNANYARGYACRGIAYDWLNDREMAIADYSKAIALDSNDCVSYGNRAEAYKKVGDLDRALADYEHLLHLDPARAPAHYRRGLIYAEKGDHFKAVANFSHALELDPNYLDAYNERGKALAHLGDDDEAIADFSQILMTDPNDVHAYVNRGNVHRRVGNYSGAISDLDNALRIDPNNPAAHNNLGGAYAEMGDHNSAIESYNTAIKLDPEMIESHFNRGSAFLMQGDYERRDLRLRPCVGDRPGQCQSMRDPGFKLRSERRSRYGNL